MIDCVDWRFGFMNAMLVFVILALLFGCSDGPSDFCVRAWDRRDALKYLDAPRTVEEWNAQRSAKEDAQWCDTYQRGIRISL